MMGGKSAAQSRPTALGTMTQASTYGMTIPTIYGTIKSTLLAIWAQNLRSQGNSDKKGKKKSVTTYVENIDFMIGSNPIQGCLAAWLNNNRYPINIVKQRSNIGTFAPTITITDADFYAVIGVTAEVSLSGTFNDYGSNGSEAWGPTVYEYPLWNKALAGPDVTDSSGARWFPYVFFWNPAAGDVVDFHDLAFFPNTLPTNGFVNIYYAQFSPLSHNQAPIHFNRMTFENQLGNGPEYSGYTAQQIIYPEYAGLGSPDIDLGASALLPTIRVEVQGSHPIYGTGDADYFDMIEDVLKSGLMQVGGGLGLIHRGVNLNSLPGPVQKDFSQRLPLSNPTVIFRQPNMAGSRLVAMGRSRPAAGNPTIADTPNANSWNSVILDTQKGMWYSDPCVGGPSAGGNAVTMTPNGGSNFDGGIYVLELDPSLDTLDNSNTNAGSGSTATCSIATTGVPSVIIATVFCDNTSGIFTPDSHWKDVYPASQDGSMRTYMRKVYGPGTYTFKVALASFASNWWVGVVAFTPSKPAPYVAALGDILDSKTLALARTACRAGGLYGSMVMDSQRTAADVLADLYSCANAWPVWSGFRLKSIPRSEVSEAGNGAVYVSPTASGPVVDVTEDDMIGDKDGQLLQIVDKTPGIDEPNILQIEFLDRSSDYNPSVASWPENATAAIYGPKKGGASDDSTTGSPKVLHQIMDPLIARKLLAIQARRNAIVVPRSFKFKGKTQLQLLEPGDLVTINDSLLGISQMAVRLTSVSEDDKYGLDFEAELFCYGVHAPDPALVVTATGGFQPNLGVIPANVNTPVIFEPVLRLSETMQAQLWAVVSDSDPNYGGCIVYLSTDGGTSYNPIGQIAGNGTTGVTTADWPSANDPDTTNDLPVDLTESLGSLASYQVSDEDNFVYPCYVANGSANIPYGLMAYAVATLTAANKYTLKATGGGTNHLRRCVFGAPANVTDVDHPSGSRFAFLNPSGQGIFKVNLDPKWIGVTLHFKFVAFNTFQAGQQALASVTDYTYTPTGLPGQTQASSSNTYVQSPAIALSQPSDVQISMAQVSVQFPNGTVNYNARNFTIPDPAGTPTVYYVTIADPGALGDTGVLTNLTATCQASNALVGVPGNTYIGFIQATHAAGATAEPAPGGWPPPQGFIID